MSCMTEPSVVGSHCSSSNDRERHRLDKEVDPEELAEMLSEELGDASGFLEVVYREMCSNHAEAMIDLQTRGVTDSQELLRVMSDWEETKFRQYLKAEAPVLRKNGKRAQQLRDQGNKAYTSKKNDKALKFYTDSIRFAPYFGTGQGEELALALANRSAVLVHIKEFRLALQDISQAILAGYPADLKYKLMERRAKCYKEVGEINESIDSYTSCIQSVDDSKMENEKKEKFKENIKNILNEMPENKDDNIKDDFSKTTLQLSSPHPFFSSFSDAVEMRFESGERGRYGVASRDIKIGELICLEEPPVFFLHEETSGINCSHCFKESLAPLPSPTCTQTVFCSSQCQNKAMGTYHVRESKFMDVLFQHGLKKKEWFLALRAITMKPLSFFMENLSQIEYHNPNFGVNAGTQPDIYHSSDFAALYHLVGHHDQWNFREHAYKAFFALFFVRCLQKSNYFEEKQSGDRQLGKEEETIGSLMIHLMEVATMNSHEVGQLEVEGEDQNWLLGQTKPVGCAIEPTLVLLNHSCNPVLIRVNLGTSTACYASRDLNKGEEITDSYSHAYDVTNYKLRNPDLLNKYKFHCSCEACEDEWPTFHELPRSFNDVPNEKLNFAPEEIMQVQSKMMMVQKLGARINQLQQKNEFDGAMDLYREFLSSVKHLMLPPHQFYVIARRSFSTCLWVKWGNKIRRRGITN